MAPTEVSLGSKKRKKHDGTSQRNAKRRIVEQKKSDEAQIQLLEDQISESRKYYNNIVTLLSMLDSDDNQLPVAVALCRVFCRLLAGGQFNKPKNAPESESILVSWLKETYQTYQKSLIRMLNAEDPSTKTTALNLSMQLLKEHTEHMLGSETQVWNGGFFDDVLISLIEPVESEPIRTKFIETYLTQYHDIAVHTVLRLTNYLSSPRRPEVLENAVTLLSNLGNLADLPEHLTSNYTTVSKTSSKSTKAPFTSPTSFKIRVQSAWLAVMRNDLTLGQRKHLLRIISHVIAPWFAKPELLMDFLTDSYNAGGSISLLALQGLFYLMQEKNLDYPQFYLKLYSLLDGEVMHSKHRSRFFRLLDTFLGSTHLPAALVASFIKRMAGLALCGPPAAIVVVVPWIYNLLKTHPTCTFMIHRDSSREQHVEGCACRTVRKQAGQQDKAKQEMVFEEPFDANEPDPSLTNAIESCLWEIETLQAHYHPNTAALARIISEQFTKQHYNIEDFLDHSYQAMLSTELGVEEKQMRKAPVVEFQIPKRIFTDRMLKEDGGVDTEPGHLIRKIWDFT